MITGQAAAVRGNSAYLLDGQTYPWISSSSNTTALPSRLAINRNALAATQAALATNLTSEELIRRNPTIAYRYTLIRDQGTKGREKAVSNRDAGEKSQRCFNCNESGHYANNCRYAKREKSRDRDDRSTSGRHRHKRSRSRSDSSRSRSRSPPRKHASLERHVRPVGSPPPMLAIKAAPAAKKARRKD